MINKHVPVMLNQSIDYLSIKDDGVYVDCTFGSGGHSREILKKLGPSGKLIAFDCDSTVNFWVSELNNPCFIFINDNFSCLFSHLERLNIKRVDGFIFDIGLSSMQLEMDRGFSYRQLNSPLDMRMNQNSDLTAEYIINNFSEGDLADIIYKFGEERKSYQIAKAICNYRQKEKIINTEILTKIVAGVVGKQKGKQHPAKKTFQALRVLINDELNNLVIALQDSLNLLADNGKVIVISYHSLEDRIVKNIFKEKYLADKNLYSISKKPILPSKEEVLFNRKSRSAKMRIIQKFKN